MSEKFAVIATTREEAHVASRHAYAHAQTIIMNGGRAAIGCAEYEEDRTLAQNKFYWGACLTEISEQASIMGQRWTVDAWHELFKRQFLGYEVVKVRVAGRARVTTIRRLKSTTKQKVKPMSVYIDKVQAFAAAELGVRFSASAQREYQALPKPAARKVRQEQREEATA